MTTIPRASEASLRKRLMFAFRAMKGLGMPIDWWSVSDALERGLPDILVCYRGRLITPELKAFKAGPTPLQIERLTRVAKAGGLGLIMTSDPYGALPLYATIQVATGFDRVPFTNRESAPADFIQKLMEE